LTVNIKQNGNRKLSLKDLSSAFLLLGCGCVASFVAFIFELIIAARWHQSKFHKNDGRKEGKEQL